MTVYEIITDRIVRLLEQGVVAWHKPWVGGTAGYRNYVSKKPYRGINVWLCHAEVMAHGWTSPEFLTFKQANNLGARIKKGAKSFPVIFWQRIAKEERDENNVLVTKRFPILKYFNVFNVADVEGLPEVKEVATEPVSSIDACESIVANYANAPKIEHADSSRAFYRVVTDTINTPEKKYFDTLEYYYATMFHEMAHSTGHASRLDRELANNFGDDKYSKEELIAEMGAAFLCGVTGIEGQTITNSAAYISSWSRKLKAEPRWLVAAAGAAQKAADHIMGIVHSHDE